MNTAEPFVHQYEKYKGKERGRKTKEQKSRTFNGKTCFTREQSNRGCVIQSAESLTDQKVGKEGVHFFVVFISLYRPNFFVLSFFPFFCSPTNTDFYLIVQAFIFAVFFLSFFFYGYFPCSLLLFIVVGAYLEQWKLQYSCHTTIGTFFFKTI